MAPTICDDSMEPFGIHTSNRLRRQCSVINYAGHQIRRDDERRRDAVDSSDDNNRIRDQLSERRINNNNNIIKRYRHETEVSSDSDNSSDSISSPMAFHNYAKRRRLSESEDENYISTSSESNDQIVSSTISSTSSSSSNDDSDRENMTKFSISRLAFAPYSPVSSTTGALALYRQLSKAAPRQLSPFYRQDLMEIAMKTIILLQKNRSLHARLHQLKLETRDFVDSVMANPENAKLRQTVNQSNDKSTEHPAFKVLSVKNQ